MSLPTAAPSPIVRDLGPYADRSRLVLSIWHKDQANDDDLTHAAFGMEAVAYFVSHTRNVETVQTTINSPVQVNMDGNRVGDLRCHDAVCELNMHLSVVASNDLDVEYLKARVGGLFYRIWLEIPAWTYDADHHGWIAFLEGRKVACLWLPKS